MAITPQQLSSYLWATVDQLRGSISTHEAMEYLTGLVFLRLLGLKADSDGKVSISDHGRTGNLDTTPDSRWEVIRDSLNPHEALTSTIDTIESDDPGWYGELLTFLPLRRLAAKPTLCRQLVKDVSKIDLVGIQGQELAAIVDYLLTTFASAHGVQGGEFYTSLDLATLLVKLLDPEPGKSICDPTCGTGSLLLAAYQYSVAKDESGIRSRVLGQELNRRTAAIARMNAVLHGLPGTVIATGDSLLQAEDSGAGNGRFDFLLMNPPIGLKHDDISLRELEQARSESFQYGPPTRVADFNFIQDALTRLNDSGRAALLIGLRPLFVGGQEGEIRRRIVEADVIEAVITLPEKLLPQTNAPCAVLLINKMKAPERKNSILFVSADNEYLSSSKNRRMLSDKNQERIIVALKRFQSEPRFAATTKLDEVEANDFVLLPDRYISSDETDAYLGEDAQYVELSSFAQVIAGTRIGKTSEGNVPLIQGRDLGGRDLSVDDLEKKNIPDSLSGAIFSQVGDVLVQRIGRRPQAFLIEEDLAGVLISDTVHVVRFYQDNRPLARYIVEFLNSNAGQSALSTNIGGAVVPTLRLTGLRNVRVPIPRHSVIELINDLHKVERDLITRVDKARDLRQQLFSIKDPERFNEQLQNLNIEAQVLSKSIIHADDLNFQLRNYYPYILAYAYRALDAYDAQQDSTVLYKEQLRVAENLLAFLGLIGLALAAATDSLRSTDNRSLTPDVLRAYWQNGISPGDWQSMGSKTAALLRGKEQFAAASSFSNIWFKGRGGKQSEFGALTQELVKLKNDFKHDRGPQTASEYATAAQSLMQILRRCMHEIAFLVQHPLRLIQDSDINWKTGRTIVNTLVYAGDHPGLRQEKIIISQPIPKGKLYFELKEEALIPLYPLISVHYCESCKMREAYMIDRWGGPNNRTVLKSFERGHTHDNTDVAKEVGGDLEYWLIDVFSENKLARVVS